jgi:hypothetical protein
MKLTTLELPFLAAAPSDPDVVWLQEYLRENGGWVKAAALSEVTGGRLDDRQLRALASASDGAVISSCHGYRHISTATAEEIARASDRLISQGREMIDRGVGIRRRAHGMVGGAGR